MSAISSDLDFIFSERGPLASAVDGFRARAHQVEMARAIAQALAEHSVLIAEAGTGTGKTFAYLVPALMSGGKVIVSTGTKTLQDQLFDRDIPTVRAALKVPVTVALLKGRANYVCHYHLERAAADGRFGSREDVRHLRLIERYARTSKSGDKSDLGEVPESAPIWSVVTSTRENCLGSECPHYGKCFVMEARRQALAADVVVVNHHLFFADVVLRDEGVSELLPACNAVIFDEAHQLPETASLFFGESVSTAQLLELARDARAEALQSARDFAPLPEAIATLDKAARDLRIALGDDSGRVPLKAAQRHAGFDAALDALAGRLDDLGALLEAQAERSEGLHNCWMRAMNFKQRLTRFRDEADAGHVRWVELYSHSAALNTTPLSIAEIFRRQIGAQARAWVFTSATLSVNRDFSHYTGQMGLGEARAESWDSPFDYPAQALLYVPERMPEPNTPGYTPAVVAAALPAIRASRGRAFLLFTSLRAMREGHELIAAAFEREGLDYPLLMQGEGSRTELLERFRALGNAVLIGSQSFWEGVDVRGEALSLVVIDKLPFAPPDDPVLAARIESINQQGRNAFLEYQLPEAAISLKQGAGRLIRDETDRGVLMICDPRLIGKSYGKRIWQSLPPMRRTRSIDDVREFFEEETKPRMSAGERE
ncbi:MAG TPA: ATP-dependent DNA helicase [Burkholderiales bacterium]|nr:ATP-dependent DNA helicase [Burkholderiales bacterium]